MKLGDFSKIPIRRVVYTSDNTRIGETATFYTDSILVSESLANSEPPKYKLPWATIALIEENRIRLNIARREIDKYIRKGDDPGKTRGANRSRFGITIEDSDYNESYSESDFTYGNGSEITSADDSGRTRQLT